MLDAARWSLPRRHLLLRHARVREYRHPGSGVGDRRCRARRSYPDRGGGLWELDPERAIAMAAVYFLLIGLNELLILGPRKKHYTRHDFLICPCPLASVIRRRPE